MKYYLGHIHIFFGGYTASHCVCIAAKDEVQATKLHFTALREALPGLVGPDENGTFKNQGISARHGELQAISPVTFQELSLSVPTFGDAQHQSIEHEEPVEQAKTLARRLSDNLERHQVSVSYNKMLQAVAASLGHTELAVLQSQRKASQPVLPPSNWLPTGNWPKTPLREAASVMFAARVDAIWLAQGDVALAAKLLHVDPEALLQSFKSAEEADVAFCGRAMDWSPEDSLSGSFGAQAEKGITFDVKVKRGVGGSSVQVEGYVDGREILVINQHVMGVWRVASSATLPSDYWLAQRYRTCINAVFAEAGHLMDTDFPPPAVELVVTENPAG